MAAGLHKTSAQGLRFHGKEKDIAERSALTLPAPDASPMAVNSIKVDFSLRINNTDSPGFIFGIKNCKTGDTFNLMYRHQVNADSAFISFAKEGERELCTMPYLTSHIRRKLIHVEVNINTADGNGSITIDGNKFALKALGTGKEGFIPRFNFGLTRHIVETASADINDLRIDTDGIVTIIPLNESSGNEVHDANGNIVGLAHNPIWLINEAFHWQQLAGFKSSTPTGCAFNPRKQQFFSYNADSLRTFDVTDGTLNIIPLKGEGRLSSLHGMNFYDTHSDKILAYEIYYNNFTGSIDPKNGEWKTLAKTSDNKAIHHHAHLLCDNDSTVILFGGYGDRKYFNKLVKFNLYTHRFDTIHLSGDQIPPRFFASMMHSTTGDSIYLYGGKGNLEGDQDLGVKYYYDLYLIDLKKRTSKKLWTQAPPDKDRVPARTLMPSSSKKYFYAMTYPEYRPHSSLQLYRISIADGSETPVGDSIPMVSEEIATNVALYKASADGRIFCVIQEFEKNGATTTRIYSISDPPVSESELSAYNLANHTSKKKIILLTIPALIIIGICVAMLYRRKKRQTNPTDSIHESSTESVKSVVKESPRFQQTAPRRSEPLPDLPPAGRISLFGPFSTIDSQGIDITHLFSPKLKKIFIYLLMESLRRGGVSATDLNAVFWPDKEHDKIKNLRNVTIAKLRKVLAELPDIALNYTNGMFAIEIKSGCFCDIERLLLLTDNLKNERPSQEHIPEILAIMCQGKFLQGSETPESDRHRSVVESYTIDFLAEVIKEHARLSYWEEVIRYCNIIFLTDPVSEIALHYGVAAYMSIGKQAQAHAMYDRFATAYKKLYSEDYPRTFQNLSSSKP